MQIAICISVSNALRFTLGPVTDIAIELAEIGSGLMHNEFMLRPVWNRLAGTFSKGIFNVSGKYVYDSAI